MTWATYWKEFSDALNKSEKNAFYYIQEKLQPAIAIILPAISPSLRYEKYLLGIQYVQSLSK